MPRKNKQLENDPIAQAIFNAEMQQREEDESNFSIELTDIIYRNMGWGSPNLKKKNSGGTDFRSVGDITEESEFLQKLAA